MFLPGCLFVLGVAPFVHAQTLKPLEDVVAEKVAIKCQNPEAVVDVRDILENYDSNRVFAQAMQLIEDPNAAAKQYGYVLLQAAGVTYQDPVIRQTAVRVYVEDFTDPGQSGSCSKMLLEYYQQKDYNPAAKNKLRQRLEEVISNQSRGFYARDIILLVGAADMQTEMDQLQMIINKAEGPLQPFRPSPKWHSEAFTALMARARMGDQDAVQQCISLVDAETDEDFKVSTLLKQIEYIRQPQAVEYIKQYLYSDKKSRDLGPDAIGGPYAYRVTGLLEKMVVGFPKRVDMNNHIQKYVSDKSFMEKWPQPLGAFMAHALYCREWFENQQSIEIIR